MTLNLFAWSLPTWRSWKLNAYGSRTNLTGGIGAGSVIRYTCGYLSIDLLIVEYDSFLIVSMVKGQWD